MEAIAGRGVQDGRPAGHQGSRGCLGPQLLTPKLSPGGCWRGWPQPRPHPPAPGPGLGPLPGRALPGIAPDAPLPAAHPRPSTCGAREPQGHVGSAECGQELETLLSQGARHRTSPLGGSLPSPPWDLQPLLCPLPPLSPRLRAETGPPASAIHLCPPQTVALFFWVTLAPTPGPAGWRRA